MIVATISGAQLDTIDPGEMRQLVALARFADKVEHMAAGIQRMGLALASSALMMRHLLGVVVIDCNAPQGDRATLDRHVLTLPRFEEPPRFNFARDVPPNPSAPIPDRLRRRADRNRWR